MLIPAYPWELLALVFLMAALYSSVGHGGASGYLAAMALFALAPQEMKPAALLMNVFVATLVLGRLARVRRFPWRVFLPIMTAALPMAFLGGMIQLEASGYRYLVGAALLAAAWRFFVPTGPIESNGPAGSGTRRPQTATAAAAGAGLGLLAGLTGVGGGIYLSPLLVLLGWCSLRDSAAVAAAFILCNSLAGLAGHGLGGGGWPPGVAWLVGAAVAGALLGSELLVRRAAVHHLCALLGIVLVIAGLKMIWTA